MASLTANSAFSSKPSYPLYDSAAVAGATFLGSPIAGSILLALNYRRLGRPGNAVASITLGAVATLVLVFLAYALPLGSAGMMISGASVLLMFYIAKKLQGPAVEAHRNAGGPNASRLKAAGVGLLALLVIVGIAFAVVMVSAVSSSSMLGKHVTVGTKDAVYFRDGITEQEATAVGTFLKSQGYFTDRGVTVALSKDGDVKVVSFVVADGAWDQPRYVTDFEEIGKSLTPNLGGLPITVRLMNDKAEVKKEMKLN